MGGFGKGFGHLCGELVVFYGENTCLGLPALHVMAAKGLSCATEGPKTPSGKVRLAPCVEPDPWCTSAGRGKRLCNPNFETQDFKKRSTNILLSLGVLFSFGCGVLFDIFGSYFNNFGFFDLSAPSFS